MSAAPASESTDDSPALRLLGRVVGALAGAAMAVGAAGLLLSLALIAWSVVMRYVFNAAPVWVDDAVGFLLVATVMLAAAQTLRRDEHIGVDILTTKLGPKGQRWARAWAAIASGAVGCLLIFNGWDTAMLAKTLGLLTEGGLEWPTWLLMLLMPLGGALLLLASVEALWRAIAGAPPIRAPRDEKVQAE